MRNQPEPSQSQPKKPEWFELLDGDAPSAQVTKVNKKLPVIAAVVTGAVIASGALFAGASTENSTGQSAVAYIGQVENVTTSSSVTTAEANAGDTTSLIQGAAPQSPALNNPAVKNPAGGMQAPGGYDDDDDDDDDDDERRDRREGRDRDHDDDD